MAWSSDPHHKLNNASILSSSIILFILMYHQVAYHARNVALIMTSPKYSQLDVNLFEESGFFFESVSWSGFRLLSGSSRLVQALAHIEYEMNYSFSHSLSPDTLYHRPFPCYTVTPRRPDDAAFRFISICRYSPRILVLSSYWFSSRWSPEARSLCHLTLTNTLTVWRMEWRAEILVLHLIGIDKLANI